MKINKYTDLVGIISSLLCLIHCFVFPLILLWYSTVAEGEGAWYMLDIVFVVISGVAVLISAINSHMVLVKIGLCVSYLLFAVSIFMHHLMDVAMYVSFVSSIALVVFHAINLKMHYKKHHVYAYS